MTEFLEGRIADSLGISGYQSAGFIHYLNGPVAPELHERFDVVVEAGALSTYSIFRSQSET